MGESYFTTGVVAMRLGIKRYRLEYMLTNGILPDTARVGNRRLWTERQVDELKTQLRQYEEKRSKDGLKNMSDKEME